MNADSQDKFTIKKRQCLQTEAQHLTARLYHLQSTEEIGITGFFILEKEVVLTGGQRDGIGMLQEKGGKMEKIRDNFERIICMHPV